MKYLALLIPLLLVGCGGKSFDCLIMDDVLNVKECKSPAPSPEPNPIPVPEPDPTPAPVPEPTPDPGPGDHKDKIKDKFKKLKGQNLREIWKEFWKDFNRGWVDRRRTR